MSIQYVTEKEQQLTHYLAEVTKALELMRQERDAAYERAAKICETEWEYSEERVFGNVLAAEIRALKGSK